MKYAYCPDCRRETGHARRLGWGTFFAAIFTLGFSLFLIPFYPKRCTICGRKMSSASASAYVSSSSTPSSGLPTDLSEETKTCPACAETIKLAANKCRFCGERFNPDQVAKQLAALEAELSSHAGQIRCPYCRQWDVVPHAMLPDGGYGPWCPRCQKPV